MASRKERIQTELLVLRYRRGDERALEELVSIWERPLFYYIRRLVDSEEDAWDVLQEVWFKVIRKVRKLRDPAAFPPWLYKLARSSAIDHLRRNPSFTPFSEHGQEQIAIQDEVDVLSWTLEAEKLHWGLSRLSHHHREALILHFLEGFSLAEISEITGASVGTIKSRLHYARKSLRSLLEREAGSHE